MHVIADVQDMEGPRRTPSGVAPEDGYFADEPPDSLIDIRDDLAIFVDEVVDSWAPKLISIVPVSDEGWVYILRAVGLEAVKIGFTSAAEPSARIASLQTGCPFDLELESFFCGTVADERALHEALDHRRARGEWFVLNRAEVHRIVRNGERGWLVRSCHCGAVCPMRTLADGGCEDCGHDEYADWFDSEVTL